jgi:hypothetical protein
MAIPEAEILTRMLLRKALEYGGNASIVRIFEFIHHGNILTKIL